MKAVEIKARGVRAAQIANAYHGRVVEWRDRKRVAIIEVPALLAADGVPLFRMSGFVPSLLGFETHTERAQRIRNGNWIELDHFEPTRFAHFEIDLRNAPVAAPQRAPSVAQITRQSSACA